MIDSANTSDANEKAMSARRVVAFGDDFSFDAARKVLWRGAETVQLAPKACELLGVLIENAPQVVSKEELMNLVWADSFVEEANLTHHISALRKTLGEDKAGRKYIETIPRKGYRFVAPLNANGSGAATEIVFSERTTAHYVEQEEIETGDSETNRDENPSFAPLILPDNENSSIKYLPAPPKTYSRRLMIFTATALILLLTGFGFAFYKFFGNAPPTEFRGGKLTKLTTTGKIVAATVSADGKFVAYAQETADGQSLWIRQTGNDGNTQIIAPTKTTYRGLNFSPDGNRLYYVAGKLRFRGTLYQTTALGGQARKIADDLYLDNGTNGAGFSPDGKQMAFLRMNSETGETSVVIADAADGANERVFISRQKPTLLFGTPIWSPDGKSIACPIQEPGVMNVLIVNLADGASRKVSQTDLSVVTQAAWLPDSKHLLVVAENEAETPIDQIYQFDINDGIPHRVNSDFNNYESAETTADGTRLAALRTVQESYIWTMPSDDASRIKQITSGAEKYDGIYGIGWQPDGKIVYEAMPGGRQTVGNVNADGTQLSELAHGGYGAASPDGRLLVYQKVAFQAGKIDIGLYLFDTVELVERRLTNGLDVFATFAPDGKSIVFTRWGDDADLATLWRIAPEGGEPQRLTKFQVISHAFSPDGSLIACAVWRGGKKHIVVIRADSGDEVKDLETDYQIQDEYGKRALQWTSDGGAIVFIRDRDGVSNLWRQSLNGGEPTQITDFTSNLIFNFAFSPDGRQIAFSRGTVNRDAVLIENDK